MRSLTDERLEGLQACTEAACLTPAAEALLADPDLAEPMRQHYASTRFLHLEGVLNPEPLKAAAAGFSAMLAPLAQEVIMRHQPGPDGKLSDGSRFRRVDPAFGPDPALREKLGTVLERVGFLRFGAALGARLSPLIRRITGPVTYRRPYLYLYEEGDYISAHDDSHVGDRVDVQFPVTLAGAGGIRVLKDGLFEMVYDRTGSMNILGPAMWHDVPPLMRTDNGTAPRRVNIGLRFTPD